MGSPCVSSGALICMNRAAHQMDTLVQGECSDIMLLLRADTPAEGSSCRAFSALENSKLFLFGCSVRGMRSMFVFACVLEQIRHVAHIGTQFACVVIHITISSRVCGASFFTFLLSNGPWVACASPRTFARRRRQPRHLRWMHPKRGSRSRRGVSDRE